MERAVKESGGNDGGVGMLEKDRELKDQYIYEVIRKIPKEQREDLRAVLDALEAEICMKPMGIKRWNRF